MTDTRDEHYESIPWDALVTEGAGRRRRWLYVAAAALVLGSLSAAIVRSLPASPALEAPASTTTTAVAEEVMTTQPLVESDLLAAAPSGGATDRAVAVGIWFLADYFTVDGSELTRASLESMLPDHVELPAPDRLARSFVETAVPLSVDELDEGVFRLVGLVRSLAAANGQDYVRQAPRAVEVLVSVTPDGVAVLDLPRPLPLPEFSHEPMDLHRGDAPDAVLAAALAEAGRWGVPESVPVSVGTAGAAWRVVLIVEDGAGLRWPVAGWFDAEGNPTTVPVG